MCARWCPLPVVAGDDDVHAGAGLADVGHLLVVHLPQRVGEGARGVDHALGTHVKLLTCEDGYGACEKRSSSKGRRSMRKVQGFSVTAGMEMSSAKG